MLPKVVLKTSSAYLLLFTPKCSNILFTPAPNFHITYLITTVYDSHSTLFNISFEHRYFCQENVITKHANENGHQQISTISQPVQFVCSHRLLSITCLALFTLTIEKEPLGLPSVTCITLTKFNPERQRFWENKGKFTKS